MAKQIKFTFDGVDYTLEFTRKSIETMERQGFNISKIADAPMTTLPTMFAGSFLAHHKFVKRETIDKIYNKMTDKESLIGKLAEMYNEPIMALMEEPKEVEGNLTWNTNW